jgi:hypothetical protein
LPTNCPDRLSTSSTASLERKRGSTAEEVNEKVRTTLTPDGAGLPSVETIADKV